MLSRYATLVSNVLKNTPSPRERGDKGTLEAKQRAGERGALLLRGT